MSKMFDTLLGEGDQDPSFGLAEFAKDVMIDMKMDGPVVTQLALRCVRGTKLLDTLPWYLEVTYQVDGTYTTYFETGGTGMRLTEEELGILQSMLYIADKVGKKDQMMIHDLKQIAQSQVLTEDELYDVMCDVVQDFLTHGREEVLPERLNFNLRAGKITSDTLVSLFGKAVHTTLAMSYK